MKIDKSISPPRPILRWHGGKWMLAPWIIEHLPAHRVYVEPYGGAASVLLRKPFSYAEVYNDLDSEVVNLFEVLRSANAGELIEGLKLTPFAREEFFGAYQISEDPIEKARRLIIRSFMGFGSDGFNINFRTGFRANSNRAGTTPAHDWANYPAALVAIQDRFTGVIIESRPALDVMAKHDGEDTLHYVDPPYLPETRSGKKTRSGAQYHSYVHELDENDHWKLLLFLRDIEGMVVLSGYPAPLYDEALPDWKRVERIALADGARERTEVLWINPRAAAALKNEKQQADMFPEPIQGAA